MHLANLADRTSNIIHGMAMFGISVMAVVVTVTVGGAALSGGTGVAAGTHNPYMLTVSSDVGWIGFACLFLGWLGAIAGSLQQGVPSASVSRRTNNIRDICPAA